MKHIPIAGATVLLAMSAWGASTEPRSAAPAYPNGSDITFVAKVVEVREAPKESALAGVHLTVAGKETLEVYVGPKDFVKMFDVTFKPGQEVEVTGAKVSFEGREVILAKEITVGRVTLILREPDGWPNWDWNKPRKLPTGF